METSNQQPPRAGMRGWLVLLLACAVALFTAYFPVALIIAPALWAYAGARTKTYWILLPAALFAAGMLVFEPVVVAAGLTCAALLAALLLNVLLTHRFGNSDTVLLLCGVFLVGLYTAVCMPGILEGRGAFADIQATIGALNEYYHAASSQISQINPEAVALILDMMDTMYEAVPTSFVAVLCIFASVLGLSNLLFFRAFCRKQPQISISPMRAFRDWTLPRSMTFGLFVMLIGSLILEFSGWAFAASFSVTANILLGIPLLLQGISVVDFFIARSQKNVASKRALAYIGLGVLYQFVLYPLVLIGCFDQIFRLRDRMRGTPPRATV